MNSLVSITVVPQLMDDNFDKMMDEAHKQQQIALAAPDMLAALKRYIAEGYTLESYAAAVASVVKATGGKT